MNAALRARHRGLTTALAVVAAVGLILALASRPSPPTTDRLPAVDSAPEAFVKTLGSTTAVDVDSATLRMTLRSSAGDPARYAIEIQPAARRGVRGPDVLVYWSESRDAAGAGVPEGAFLLGTLAGGQTRTLPLPAAARPGAGSLLFYSLAQQRRLAQGWPLPPTD